MPRTKRVVASDLTIAELKHMLVAKEQIAPLEEKKAKLEAALAVVNAKLGKLGATAKLRRKPGRKPGRPAAKKAGRRVAKRVGRRGAKKAAPKRPATPGIQDVVVGLIRANGKPMAFQDILGAITKRKLVKTKSKDFANVLRRTISGSKAFRRVGRGVYVARG